MPSQLLTRSLAAAFLIGIVLASRPIACAGDPPKKPDAPKAPDAPKTPPAAPAPAAKTEIAVRPWGGGAVFVDVSETLSPRIGTDVAVIFNLVGSRKEVLQQFLYETPPHKVELEGFAIDATEVTNAQYLLYLDQTAHTVYTSGTTAYSSLQQIAQGLVPGVDEKDNIAWAQIYELNKPALDAGLPAMKGKPKADWRHQALPPGIDLVVYTKRLPKNWFEASSKLEADAGPDHPVRDLSYYDCRAFAEWAGKHIPTEQEWEWAARGPDQRLYPWGDDWTSGRHPITGKALIEQRCNWLDLGIVNARHEPTTVAVETLPEGRSWCGCWHMLGNAAEWTSSWFNTYPGWVGETDQVKNPLAKYPGDYVKVIRGASFMDRERLALRCGVRAFIGGGNLDPQTPENRFANVGFRCATYLRPGLDRLETVVAKLTKPKKLREENLAPARLGGATTVRWTAPGQPAENHVHVLGKSATVLLCPTRALNLDDTKIPYARSAQEVLEKTREESPRIFGAFHTDVPIAHVRIAVKGAPPPKRAGRMAAEPAVSGPDQKIAAGSYILGLWFGEVAVFAPNLDFVGYLGKPTVVSKNLEKKEGVEPSISSTVSVDGDLETVKFAVWVSSGGKGVSDVIGYLISWGNKFEEGALEKAGRNWRDSAPAAPAAPAEKPAGKPAEKPADKPAEKPADKPADKPAEKPADKPK